MGLHRAAEFFCGVEDLLVEDEPDPSVPAEEAVLSDPAEIGILVDEPPALRIDEYARLDQSGRDRERGFAGIHVYRRGSDRHRGAEH